MHRVERLTSHLQPRRVSAASSNPYNKPVKVLVTGAAGNIAYSILFGIGRGKLLGANQSIELYLLDIPPMASKMNGVVMELKDCSFPLLTKIIATTDYSVAFKDIEIALLIGARPRSKGMLRADLLKSNANIFEGQGKALEKYSDRNVKVCVVGNPANTNALITMMNAPSIPKQNFTAMTRLDQNRAISQIAEKINCSVDCVQNVVIWGNHSKTQYPDISNAYIINKKKNNIITTVRSAVNDDEWLDNKFITSVQQRGAEIINARGLSSAASAANACLDHVRDWICGTKEGKIVSMAVISDGNPYGIPDGIIYSFPVICSNGNWRMVQLPVNQKSRQKMLLSAKELINEKDTILSADN